MIQNGKDDFSKTPKQIEEELLLNAKEAEEELVDVDPAKEEETDDENPFEVEFNYKKKGDEEPPPPPDDKPADKSKDEKEKEALFAKIKELYPDAVKDAKSIEDVFQKPSAPPPPPVTPKEEDIKLPELNQQEMSVVLSQTFKAANSSGDIRQLVDFANKRAAKLIEKEEDVKPLTRVPATPEEWENLHNISPVYYQQMLDMVKGIQGRITKDVQNVKYYAENQEGTNSRESARFVEMVDNYVKSIYKDATVKDTEKIAAALKEFVEREMDKPEYYNEKFGSPILSADLCFAKFVAQNTPKFGELSMLAARKASRNTKLDDLKVRGKSQSSLVSEGLNNNKTKRVDLTKAMTDESLSEKEILGAMRYIESLGD